MMKRAVIGVRAQPSLNVACLRIRRQVGYRGA